MKPLFTLIISIVLTIFTGCSDAKISEDMSTPENIIDEPNINENRDEPNEDGEEIIIKETEPYINPFQPDTERDPSDPIYIQPVEPEKEYINGKELRNLVGDIEQDIFISSRYYWKISGDVRVKAGYRLSIEEGTTIFGDDKLSKISFEVGSELIAIGKKDNPIIFTSQNDILGISPKAGDWGGITLSETKDSVLKYIQIRYSGYNRASIEFDNIENGTVLEFIEIFLSSNDGIQLSGGEVNLRNSIILGANGDSLSLKNGWSGKVQNLYIHQFENIFGDKSSGVEVGGDVKDVTLSNLIIVSNILDVGAGIYLRDGSSVKIINSIVAGKRSAVCLKAEKLSTDNIFESNIFGDCLDGHSQNLKIDNDLNYLTSESISLEDLSKNIAPINPYSLDSWFDDYPELYIGSFNFNSAKKWSDSWSIGMEEIFNGKK